MHPAWIAASLFGTLLAATARQEKKRVDDESLEELVARALADKSLSVDELDQAATGLEEVGEVLHARALRLEAAERRGAPPERVSAVAQLCRAYRLAGSKPEALVSLDPSVVRSLQGAFGIDPSGVYDLPTAMLAQSVDPAAPACAGLPPAGLKLDETRLAYQSLFLPES